MKKLYPCFLCKQPRNKCRGVLCFSCIAGLDAVSPTLKRANKVSQRTLRGKGSGKSAKLSRSHR